MAIYITGDTHGHINLSKIEECFTPQLYNLTKEDYVIICGDFGGVWYNNPLENNLILDWWDAKDFTTLFVDGNHENFNLLNQYPITKWNGGKVHQIKNSVFHLMRGQIFTIDKLKFFTMGGATSIDKANRIENLSWWKEELPSYKEEMEALTNLEKENFKVDYILTHTAPQAVINEVTQILDKKRPGSLNYESDSLTNFLEEVRQATIFRKWFFGHFHIDYEPKLDKRFQAAYNNIYQIGE